jgi:hypothetical protein
MEQLRVFAVGLGPTPEKAAGAPKEPLGLERPLLLKRGGRSSPSVSPSVGPGVSGKSCSTCGLVVSAIENHVESRIENRFHDTSAESSLKLGGEWASPPVRVTAQAIDRQGGSFDCL